MKNPWMSLWLSSANAMAGSMFGQAAAFGQRQMNVISNKAAEDMMNLWLSAWMLPGTRPARRRR